MPNAPKLYRPHKAPGRRFRAPDNAQTYARQSRRALPTHSRRWRRIRAYVLSDQPICAICDRSAATEVDHIDEDATNNERDNLQGLCKSCHSRKTGQNRRTDKRG